MAGLSCEKRGVWKLGYNYERIISSIALSVEQSILSVWTTGFLLSTSDYYVITSNYQYPTHLDKNVLSVWQLWRNIDHIRALNSSWASNLGLYGLKTKFKAVLYIGFKQIIEMNNANCMIIVNNQGKLFMIALNTANYYIANNW